jgi:NTP pyrophosphatase (non-canonical NTP hydrolase)
MTLPHDDLAALLEELRTFIRERDWEQFHDPKNLAMALASEAGELLAEYRWISSDRSDSFADDAVVRLRVQREVADVAIALLLFCDRTGIDLPAAVREKLEVNSVNYPADRAKGQSSRPLRPQ